MEQVDRRLEQKGGLKPPYDPVALEDVDVVFPSRALDWMPPMSEIPADFERDSPWHKLLSAIMFDGVRGSDLGFDLKPGIDGETSTRHLFAIVGSYAPKHEHKMAAFAFLCDLWFHAIQTDDTIYTTEAVHPREKN